MFTLAADLDAWADRLKLNTGLVVTSDPGVINPPCLYVSLPDVAIRPTLTTVGLTFPLWILTDQPGKRGRDQLLTMLPNVLQAVPEGVTALAGLLTVGRTEWRGYQLPITLRFTETEG